MTTNHASKIWGYNGSPTLAGKQQAIRIRRLAPLVRDGMSTTAIRPYVVGAWPLATDAYGLAYPGGLLLVAGDVGLSGAGDIDTRCEAFWQNAITGGSANVWAVPQTLPVGYTASGQATHYGYSSLSYPGPPWVRLTTSGMATVTGWTPRLYGYGTLFTTGLSASDPGTGANGTFTLSAGLTPITADVGYRKCRMIFYVTLPSTGGGGLSGGSLAYTISHNADGSVGSNTGDLDTIDFSGTVSAAQLNAHGTNLLPGWMWNTDPIDIGATTAPLGKPCRFAIRVTANSLTYTANGFTVPAGNNYSANCQASHRVDIPFQCDIVGAGDLIAPGGYVP